MMDIGGGFGGGGGRINPMMAGMGGMRQMQARMQRRK